MSVNYKLELKLSPKLAVQFEHEWEHARKVTVIFTEHGAQLIVDGRMFLQYQDFQSLGS